MIYTDLGLDPKYIIEKMSEVSTKDTIHSKNKINNNSKIKKIIEEIKNFNKDEKINLINNEEEQNLHT